MTLALVASTVVAFVIGGVCGIAYACVQFKRGKWGYGK